MTESESAPMPFVTESDQLEDPIDRNTVLHLQCPSPGAKIYYTLRGALPEPETKRTRLYKSNKGVIFRYTGQSLLGEHILKLLATNKVGPNPSPTLKVDLNLNPIFRDSFTNHRVGFLTLRVGPGLVINLQGWSRVGPNPEGWSPTLRVGLRLGPTFRVGAQPSGLVPNLQGWGLTPGPILDQP